MIADDLRATELAKYEYAYSQPGYRMGPTRQDDTAIDLRRIPCRGSYLDVSCGRGEMLVWARKLGFAHVQGTEIVPQLIDGRTIVQAWAHALPFADKSFDVVSMFDVIEHLIPGDDERACRELARVAKRYVLLTASNRKSLNSRGDDLHINKRPYDKWFALLQQWFAPAKVIWLPANRPTRPRRSEAFRIELA